jgi:hypothetical protein
VSALPPRPTISELELDKGDELTVYLELIRIIEKDIDEIQQESTRTGWTSWTIIGGIVGALLLLFGETKNLTEFPAQKVGELLLAGIFGLEIVNLLTTIFRLVNNIPKAGRIRWSDEERSNYLPALVYRLLLLTIFTFIAAQLTLPLLPLIVILSSLGFWLLFMIFLLVFGLSRRPLGPPTVKNAGTSGALILLLLASFPAFVILVLRQPPPVGNATLPYILAGLILGIIWLVSQLVSSTTPSRLLSNLKALKNDIVFLRIDIDEALKRYEILSEGETLPDVVQRELSEVEAALNALYNEQALIRQLQHRMVEAVPRGDDSSEVIERKLTQIRLDRTSYALHVERYQAIAGGMHKQLDQLAKNIRVALTASSDVASANLIVASLQQRLDALTRNEEPVNEITRALDAYLSDSKQIPRALSKAIDDIKREQVVVDSEAGVPPRSGGKTL